MTLHNVCIFNFAAVFMNMLLMQTSKILDVDGICQLKSRTKEIKRPVIPVALAKAFCFEINFPHNLMYGIQAISVKKVMYISASRRQKTPLASCSVALVMIKIILSKISKLRE